MANRFCDRCGAKSAPMWPRQRMPNGELWCAGCAQNHGRTFTASATWSAEDAARFEAGRQRVRMVTERAGQTPRPLCEYHTSMAAGRAGLTDQIAYSTGLRDEGKPSPFQVHPATVEGRCADCTRAQAGTPWSARDRPRHAPAERQEETPKPPDEFHRGGWPYRPRKSYERSVPVPATPYSLNSMGRVAIRRSQGSIPENCSPEQRLAHFVAWDQPNMVRIAHDSGDSQTVFHCCFCGSGQVIARSDGTIECEFCHSVFTVQIQPQFPAFPQTIDGMPVDVPGMPSNTAPPAGADPAAEEGLPPGADPDGEDEEPPEEDDGEDLPPFMKGGLLTTTGAVLGAEDYLRHLAIACSSDRETTIQRVRGERTDSFR
jgi:hypothetical protein